MEPLYAQNEEEVLMNIIISNSSGKPIYEQITAQIKGMIMNGALKPGDPLPSMRLLAKELRISVITIKRAYEELERDGFISTIVGKGSFVREADREFVREEKLKAVENHLQAVVEEARQCGMEKEEVVEILNMLFEEM